MNRMPRLAGLLVLVLVTRVAFADRFTFSSDIVKQSKFFQSFSVENHASSPSFSGVAHQIAQVPFEATVRSALVSNGDSFLGVISVVDSGASGAVLCKPQDIRFYVNGETGSIECPSQPILSPSHPFTCNVQFSSNAPFSNDTELALEADLLCEDSTTTTIRTLVQTKSAISSLEGPLAAELRSDSSQISVVTPSEEPQSFPYTASAVCMDQDTNVTSLAFVCTPRRMLSRAQLQLTVAGTAQVSSVCGSSLAADLPWEMINQQSTFLDLGDRSVRLQAAFQSPNGDHLQIDVHLHRSSATSFCSGSGLARGFHDLAGALFGVSLAENQCAEISDDFGGLATLPLTFNLLQLPSTPALLPCFAALSGLSLSSHVSASVSDSFCSFVASSSASSAISCSTDIVKQHSLHSRAVRAVPPTSQITLSASLEHWFWRNYRWAVNNTVVPTSVYGFAGDSPAVGYTVDVTTDYCDSSLEVNGNITIKNTGSSSVEFTGYSATLLPDNTPIVLKCDAPVGNGATITIPSQASLVCAVGATAPDLQTRSITISVTTSVGSATNTFTAIKASTPHAVLGESATLTNDDPNFLPSQHGTAELLSPGPYHFAFQQTITCPSSVDSYLHGRLQFYVNNTAHVLSNCGIMQNDTVRVLVSCYLPRFAVEASPEFTRTFNWSLVKTANVTTATVLPGVPTVIGYTIRVSQTAQDSAYHVWGTASFFNYNPTAVLNASYTLRLSTGQAASLVNCSQSYLPSPGILAIPAGKSFDCHFDTAVSGTLPTSITLAVTLNSVTVTDSQNLFFSPSADCVNACGRVTDKASLVSSTSTLASFVLADQTVRTYTDSQTVPPLYCGPPAPVTVYNNATVLALSGSCDSTAVVTSYVLASGSAVSILTPSCSQLTASATFTAAASSNCVWTVSKAVSPSSVYLFSNQSSPVTCSVSTTRTCTNKTAISATVTITNPSAYPATLTSVVATLQPDGTQVNVLSVCPTVATITAGASKECVVSFIVNAIDSTTRSLQVDMAVGSTSLVTVPTSPIQIAIPAPTLTVTNGTATLTESFLSTSRVLTDSTSFSYACQPVVCSALASAYGSSGSLSTNVNHNATLMPSNGGTLFASATVAAVCFRPSISTTSTGSQLSAYGWKCALTSSTKSIALSDFINSGVTLSYSLAVTTVATAAGGFINGTIIVKNPHTSAVLSTTLSSALVGTATNPPVQISCSGASASRSIPISVAVNSQLTCTITATLASSDVTKSISNLASFTLYGISYSASSTSSVPTAVSSTAGTVYAADSFIVPGAAAVATTLTPSSLTASGSGFKYTYTLSRTAKGTSCPSSTNVVTEVVTLYDSANPATRLPIKECSLSILMGCGTCALSMGYWQTHSSYGPAFYDSTWARLGENNVFKNGKYTNYEIFYAPTDAYSKLGSQYIATILNIYKGSWLSTAAYNALQAADALLNNYTQDQINTTYKNDATNLASILASFTKDSCPP